MVSAGVPVPVVKAVVETVAVQLAPKPRLSVTWTVPRSALMVPPTEAEPRLELAGAVMVRTPPMTVTVAVQAGPVLPAGQVLPVAAETAVLDRTLPPVSGLSTVTE